MLILFESQLRNARKSIWKFWIGIGIEFAAMFFVITLLVTYFMTVPGLYLILRSKLASSLLEAVAVGFFIGFGLIVVSYLGLSRCMPISACDAVIVATALLCLILSFREGRKQGLPIWTASKDFLQVGSVSAAVVFMLLLAFGDLVSTIDDDVFIHLSIIKRIAMGDIPPHLPFAPDTLLRGHIGRDVFTGTVARLVDLRPELAIIYVTLALCPAYVLSFHALASRVSENNRVATCFCFFGMLFLVSFAIGDSAVRAGSITYIWNNNAFAYSYAVCFAWLIACVFDRVKALNGLPFFAILKQECLPIFLITAAFAALYFVYLSNFLMLSLFLVSLPVFTAIASSQKRVGNSLKCLLLVTTVFAGAAMLHVLISPFLWERVLTTLGIIHPKEPLTLVQQAQFSVPKENPFAITNPNGVDVPFFTWSSISSQGLSYYIGLFGLIFGLSTRRTLTAAVSWFGWLVILWLLIVDMGAFRAETLRLMLMAHIAFGAAAGLVIGFLLNDMFEQDQLKGLKLAKGTKIAAVAGCAMLCLGMGWGSIQKFMSLRHWNFVANWKTMRKIEKKNPEDWNSLLNMCAVDYQIFEALARSVRHPDQRLLLRMAPDINFKGNDHPVNAINTIVNAPALSGAGVVGVCQEHAGPHMNVQVFLYDFRSSLFWQEPTKALLDQLSPNWIIVDPQLVSSSNLKAVCSMPGISQRLSVEDAQGRKRILLNYRPEKKTVISESGVSKVNFESSSVSTERFGLANVTATIDSSGNSDDVKLGMLVYDEKGQPVNLTDIPLLSAKQIAAKRYLLSFSMIQSGRWKVALIDPVTARELTPVRLSVNVSDSAAVVKFASFMPVVRQGGSISKSSKQAGSVTQKQ